MRKLYYIFAVLSAFSFVAALFIYNSSRDAHLTTVKHDSDPSGIRDRDEWLLMRLRDPATGRIPDNINRQELNYALSMPGSLRNIVSKYDKLLSNRWSHRGPCNIGGRTRALAFDILNENNILAGGVSGGMWRSGDAGKTWSKTTTTNQLASVSCLVQDTRKGKETNWYYGTGELIGNSADIAGDGIYKSTDNGRTWMPLSGTVTNNNQWNGPFNYIWNLVINHKNTTQDELLAAVSAGGITRSTDGGKTWKFVLGGFNRTAQPPYGLYSDIAISPSGIYYATLSQESYSGMTSSVKGIFRSADGVKWTDITPANFPKKYRRVVIGIAPSDESQVYFVGESRYEGLLTINSQGDSLWHTLWKYTYKSGDGSGSGGTWEDRTMNLPNYDHWRGKMNSQFSYNLVIKVKPDNPDVVFIGHSSMQRSNDGFKTKDKMAWIGGYNPDFNNPDYRYPNHHPDIHAIVFKYSDPNAMLTGSDGGVHLTNNCMADSISWIDLNNGYLTTQFYSVALDHGTPGSDEIMGGTQDNSTLYTKWSDGNKPWSIPTSSDGFCCTIPDGGKMYYYSQNSSYQPKIKIYRIKLDENGNRTQSTRIDPVGGQAFIWNTPFLLDPNNNKRMYLAGGNIIWRNNNLDEIPFVESKDSTAIGWDSLSNTRTPSDEKITAIGVSKNPANILFYGTSKGRVFKITDADKGNPVPLEIKSSSLPKDAYVGCIAFDPADANKVYIVYTNYGIKSIFYSGDGGSTWSAISGNLEENPNGTGNGPACFWLEILPVNGKNMYFAGTSTGVYSTAYLDGMNTVWQQEGAETIGNTVVDMLDARESDGTVLAGTHGYGVFGAKITDLPSLPGIATLLSPKDGIRGIKDTIKLEWSPVKDAGFYKLEVSKSQDFSDIFLTADGLRSTTYTINSNLEPGLTRYYWRITARSAGGPGKSSDVWSFNTVVDTPLLSYPATSSDSLPLNLELGWDTVTGAAGYHLLMSKALNFSTLFKDTIVLKDNKIKITGLDKATKYYWKVAAFDDDGEGYFSKANNFRTTSVTSVKEIDFAGLDLKQNYPNPFTGNTRIEFILPKYYKINLAIYDVTGRRIAVLINKEMDGGNYSINYDGSLLLPGSYFLRLQFGEYSLTRAMVKM